MNIRNWVIGCGLFVGGALSGYVAGAIELAAHPDVGAATAVTFLCQKARQSGAGKMRLASDPNNPQRGVLSWEMTATCVPPPRAEVM